MSTVEIDGAVDPLTRPRPIRVLALSGGGYRGLFTAEVLVRIEAALEGRLVRDVFDLTAGTSAGALIAAGVACGVPAVRIRDAFLKHGERIFPRSTLTRAKQLIHRAPYSAAPLEDAINAVLGDLAGQAITGLQADLAVTTVSQVHAEARIYAAGRFAKASSGEISLRDAILASAAAPTYFPPCRPEAETLVDGGLVANAPALVGLGLVRKVLGTPLDMVEVLGIGTASPKAGYAAMTPRPYSFLSWMMPTRNLLLLTLEAQEHLTKVLTRHLLGDRYVSIDAIPSAAHIKVMGAIDATGSCANKTLAALAQGAWNEQREAVLKQLW